MFEMITSLLQRVLGFLASILPLSPLRPFIDSLESVPWLGYINWFVPVGTLMAIGGAWLIAIGVFYAYQLILRWAKAVGS